MTAPDSCSGPDGQGTVSTNNMMLPRPLGAVLAVVALGAVSRTARADLEWLPGNSRAVPRTTSASLDAPVTGLVFAPRDELKAAADLGVARVSFAGVALRPGISGFCDVQYAGVGGFWPIPPSTGQILFRGHYEISLALSAERLARAWLGSRGAIEVAMAAGHESDHVLGSGDPDSGFVNAPRHGDIVGGGGGNFLIYEIAMRVPLGARVDLSSRLTDRAYVSAPILHAPAVEAGMRWRLWPHFEPVVSVFAEALLVDHNQNAARDGGDAALLAGIALPGRFGEVIPLALLGVGNQKGLLINYRELTISIGVRYAPF
jgi:hypothetical protein